MKTVDIIKDEWYPCYSIVDHLGWEGDRKITLTQAELEQYEYAFKVFNDLQSMLEEKYNSSKDIRPDRWTKQDTVVTP